jgi:hypothetical protein
MTTYYIQRKDSNGLETVDEVTRERTMPALREARLLLAEYQSSDSSADYYISSRPCKAWKEKG